MHSDPATDPRANAPIPNVLVPVVVGEVRTAASEIRIAAEMIARLTTGEVACHARMLAAHATRLGQAANLLSAVAIPKPVAVVAPVPLPWRERWRAAWRILWRG